jgi:hypothetical protein
MSPTSATQCSGAVVQRSGLDYVTMLDSFVQATSCQTSLERFPVSDSGESWVVL